MKKLPAKGPKSGWQGGGEGSRGGFEVGATPAPRPAAAPGAVRAYAMHTRQLYYSLARSHEATHLSPSYIYSCSSERTQMKQYIIFLREKSPSRSPAGEESSAPGTASYPGPAEGCRRLQPCRASIRGTGKRSLSPSHHEMPQPDRRNQGSLSAVLARLQPRFIFFPSEELLLRCDLLLS